MKYQINQVASILKRKKKIDNFWAIDTRLSLRLGSHIHKLRGRGWNIQTTMVGKNCVYKLIKAI